jgi:hypothetical protein
MRPVRTIASTLLTLAALASGALVVACSDGRFPVCKSNAECASPDGGPGNICYNLKCVECVYDDNCPAGKACNRKLNTCESILGAPPTEEGGDSSSAWEPADWDECAKRCKEPDCISSCDQRFKK